MNIGIVGCGNISNIYFKNLTGMFRRLNISGCCDLDAGKAEEKSKKYKVPVYSTEELMKREDVDIILNLTTPPIHGRIDRMALNSGKHVYSEKPFALDREEAGDILALAEEKGLRVGCAPDTFLGSALQSCRRLMDEGRIGKPLSVFASMNCHGHEGWHPAPDFYYKEGGGPMLDMGPYYLTALVSLLGPVNAVQAVNTRGFEERICSAGERKGSRIQVEVPTHYQGLMTFENGVSGSCIMSFDTWHSSMPRIEIHGTEGSLLIPDPNCFGGTVRLFQKGSRRAVRVSSGASPYRMNARGAGLADMARAISEGGSHRADGAMAVHVLDIMLAFGEAGDRGGSVDVKSTMRQPDPLPSGLGKGEF